MLRIRKEQMDAFSRLAVEDFTQRMRVHLRESYPSQTSHMLNEDVDAVTRAALERGPRYRLETEHDVCRFAECLLTLGATFDERPDAYAELLNPEFDADDRLDAVLALHQNLSEPH